MHGDNQKNEKNTYKYLNAKSSSLVEFYSTRENINYAPADSCRDAVVLHQFTVYVPAALLTLRFDLEHQHFSNLHEIKLVGCYIQAVIA